MGVIFFVYNAIFALVLLLMVLVSSGFAVFTKNPDTRYQPMRDDRGSFIKSQTQLTTELDALGATARGEGKGAPYNKPRTGIDDDDESFTSGTADRNLQQKEGFGEHYQPAPPRSPVGSNFSAHSAPNPPPGYGYADNHGRTASLRSEGNYRAQNNASPWQRGAGYDH